MARGDDAILRPLPRVDPGGRPVPNPRSFALGPDGLRLRDAKGREWHHPRDELAEVVFSRANAAAPDQVMEVATVRTPDGRPLTTLRVAEWRRERLERWATAGGLRWRDAREGEWIGQTTETPLLSPGARRAARIVAATLGLCLALVLLLALALTLSGRG